MRINIWTVALISLLLLTALALALTVYLQDAPAWWQAILSGAALLVTAVLWQMDKQRVRNDAESDQRNLRVIIQGSVQELLTATNNLVALGPKKSGKSERGGTIGDQVIQEHLQAIDHRWQHLLMFSPYDRLGNYPLVNALADVDVCCRRLVAFKYGPPVSGPIRWGPGPTKILTVADELARRCEDACRLLDTSELKRLR